MGDFPTHILYSCIIFHLKIIENCECHEIQPHIVNSSFETEASIIIICDDNQGTLAALLPDLISVID